MKIPSKDIPQADNLDDVTRVVEAVARGARTYEDIADAIGKVDRQGRYYRRAAEILGLTERAGLNQSTLTALGRKYIKASADKRKSLLTTALLSARVVQRLIPYLESKGQNGITREEVVRFLQDVADMGKPSMAPRRAVTIIDWLSEVGLVSSKENKILLGPLPEEISNVEYKSEDEPLFPQRFDLREYAKQEKRAREKAGSITMYIDEVKRERANDAHHRLIEMMANRLRRTGTVPRSNQLIDLSGKVEGNVFLFEMKSTTTSNVRSQVRQGISQLYEYRYLQDLPGAQLVLVIENPLPRPLQWIADYLIEDRGIFLVWDGNEKFNCPDSVKKHMPFIM